MEIEPDTVVFDIGGVLLDWNPRHLYTKIFNGREAEMEWFLANICTPEWNMLQDGGRPWSEATDLLVAAHPDHEANIRAFRQRWPEMIAGPIDETVEVLRQLHAADVPVYAITNFAGDTFRIAREMYDFLHLFRDTVVSGDEKMLKPEKRIFDLLADRNALEHGKMVFIDDSPRNVEGAKAAGLHGIHFTGAGALRQALIDHGFDALAA